MVHAVRYVECCFEWGRDAITREGPGRWWGKDRPGSRYWKETSREEQETQIPLGLRGMIRYVKVPRTVERKGTRIAEHVCCRHLVCAGFRWRNKAAIALVSIDVCLSQYHINDRTYAVTLSSGGHALSGVGGDC